MSVETALPIEFSDAAAAKVKALVSEEENPDLKLRVYVTGGGCSGFQYGFTFDEKVNEGDMTIEKDSVTMVVDPMSLQYLVGGVVDYVDGLEGSRFLVQNPNAYACRLYPTLYFLLFLNSGYTNFNINHCLG